MTEILACTFSECGAELSLNRAWVPELKAIRQAEGVRPSPEMLPKHAFCKSHAVLARESGKVKMYPYIQTLKELERRQAEEKASKDFFAKYALKETLEDTLKKKSSRVPANAN